MPFLPAPSVVPSCSFSPSKQSLSAGAAVPAPELHTFPRSAAEQRGWGTHAQAPLQTQHSGRGCCSYFLQQELLLDALQPTGKVMMSCNCFFTLCFICIHLHTDKGTAAFNLTFKCQAWCGDHSGAVGAILIRPMTPKGQLLSLCAVLAVGLFVVNLLQ